MTNSDFKKETYARLVEVSKTYNGSDAEQDVLKNITFDATSGEMVLLLGPSGSGKTTFLTLLGGMQQPTSGEVYLFEKKTEDYSHKELQKLRAEKMGFIFQTFKLIESLSVLENLLLVLRFAGISGNQAKLKAIAILDELGLKKHIHSMPKSMSHGEKQRVAVARALVNNASLIIADEPTGSLNTDQGMQIVKMLRDSVSNNNRCVVIASHDERISLYADRTLYLHK